MQEAEGKQLAADFGAVFYETSAKSSSSIEELFVTLGESFYCIICLCILFIAYIVVWKLFSCVESGGDR